MSVFQGKIVSGIRYAHKCAVSLLPNTEQQLIEKMHAFLDIDTAWNVVKLEIKKPTNFSFLCYQDFSDAEFPALLKSYKYNNCDHTFKLTRYNSKNPPILHRKELLLPSVHPDYLKYETLTNNLIVLKYARPVIGAHSWIFIYSHEGFEMYPCIQSHLVDP